MSGAQVEALFEGILSEDEEDVDEDVVIIWERCACDGCKLARREGKSSAHDEKLQRDDKEQLKRTDDNDELKSGENDEPKRGDKDELKRTNDEDQRKSGENSEPKRERH